jgi:hypothetical protein
MARGGTAGRRRARNRSRRSAPRARGRDRRLGSSTGRGGGQASGATWERVQLVAAGDLSVTFGNYRRGHLLARDDVGVSWSSTSGSLHRLHVARPLHRPVRPESPAPFGPTCTRAIGGASSSWAAGPGSAGARDGARCVRGRRTMHLVAPEASVAVFGAAEPDPADLRAAAPRARGHRAHRKADAVIVGPGLGPLEPGRDRGRGRASCPARRWSSTPRLSAFAGATDRLRDALADRVAVSRRICSAASLPTGYRCGDRSLERSPRSRAVGPRCSSGCTDRRRVETGPDHHRGGNPGLATGGSGDTLSGSSRFLAQASTRNTRRSAHRCWAARTSPPFVWRAMRPSDVVAAVPDLWRGWELASRAGIAARPPVLHQLDRPRYA